MSSAAGLPEITESYEAIERLVMETPRGRWFLDEFSRRQRAHELNMVLDSIQRLERIMAVRDVICRNRQHGQPYHQGNRPSG